MSIGADTSRCPARVAARSQLGLRPERNCRGHRRDLDRVGVDGSPLNVILAGSPDSVSVWNIFQHLSASRKAVWGSLPSLKMR
jgi:hypothetical protein